MKPELVSLNDFSTKNGKLHQLKCWIRHYWREFCTIPRYIKWFIQRGWRGWADCDAWGWCSYNAQVNKEVLMHLKKIKHGVPNGMFTYWPDEDDGPPNTTIKRGEKRWDMIMGEMIFAFGQLSDDNLIDWYKNRDDNRWADFMRKYPEQKLQTENDVKRIKRGLKLYCKYYGSLWD